VDSFVCPGTTLSDAIQAVSDFEEIGAASTVHRRWFMHSGDFFLIEFLKNGVVQNRRWTANSLAM
jgi:hypothetical protein